MKFNFVINNLKDLIFSNEKNNKKRKILDKINHLNSVFHFQKLIIQVKQTFFAHSFGFGTHYAD